MTNSSKQAQQLYEGWSRADIAFQRNIQSKIADKGISGSQLEILSAVHYISNQVSVKELAKVTLKTSSAVTQLVSTLEKSGYLTRKRSETDRRVVYVHLTSVGRRRLEAVQSIVIEEIEKIISALTSEEVNEYIRINNKIANNI